MAEYTGANVYVEWKYSGGTVVLSGNQRTVSISPSTALADATAGNDTHKKYLSTVADTTISVSTVAQTGDSNWASALAPGVSGTLTVGPEGTAVGATKYEVAAICMGAKVNLPYADVVEISCDFQGNGSPTVTTF